MRQPGTNLRRARLPAVAAFPADLTGLASGVGSAQGLLSASALFVGTAASVGLASGNLTAVSTASLSGIAAGSGSAWGNLIAGPAYVTTTLPLPYNVVTAAGGPARLAGTMVATGGLGGQVTTSAQLFGVAGAVGATTGTITTTVVLAYVAAGAAATANFGDVTANYPSDLVVNDILICDVSTRDNVVLAFPANWSKKAEANNGIGLRQTIAWHRRTAGDSETSVVITHPSGGRIIARVHVIRGAATTGDPFEVVAGPTALAAGNIGAFPDVTSTTDGDLLFYAMAYAEDFLIGPTVTNAQSLSLVERDATEVS